VLHDFSSLDSNTGTNADGALPSGGLILAGNTLFGTASAGGAGGAGVVFSLDFIHGDFSVLHDFTPLDPVTATNDDGAYPFAGLTLSNGMLYGTTVAGGTGGKGVVYSLRDDGTGFAVLHNFSAIDSVTGVNADGAAPCASVALSGNCLYGTTSAGGANANGTVFSLPVGGGQFQVLHAFTAMDPVTATNRDGAFPVAGLLALGNLLYGTAFGGGPGAAGTVFGVAMPAMVTNIVPGADGSITLYFLGGPNSTNVVQSTVSLAAPTWVNIFTNIADASGAWQFTEPISTNAAKFYRSYAP